VSGLEAGLARKTSRPPDSTPSSPLRSFREEVIWLAGLWEGEGSFIIHNRVPIMSLGMTDEDTVRRAYQIMRISRKLQVRLKPSGLKTLYSLQVNASQALGWMMILYPFMHQRRRQKIREILDIWRHAPVAHRYRRGCPRGHGYDAGRNRRRQRTCRECKRLEYIRYRGTSFRASLAQPMLL
jgi:hypothetical protein